MVSSAEIVVGRKPNTGLWSPIHSSRQDYLAAIGPRSFFMLPPSTKLAYTVAARTEALTKFRQAKRKRANFKWGCRKRWMQFIVSQLHEAMDCHDMGSFYKLLKQIGVSVTEHSREGQETFSLSALRAQAMSSAGVVDDISEELITRVVPSLPCDQSLADPPSEQEILTACTALKTLPQDQTKSPFWCYENQAPEHSWQLRLILHQMWTTDSSTWDHLSMQGLAVALYKGTGDRSSLDNFRFVVLLPAISRVLARIVANRMSAWAERHQLLPQNQWGFRQTCGSTSVNSVLAMLHLKLAGHGFGRFPLLLVLVKPSSSISMQSWCTCWRTRVNLTVRDLLAFVKLFGKISNRCKSGVTPEAPFWCHHSTWGEWCVACGRGYCAEAVTALGICLFLRLQPPWVWQHRLVQPFWCNLLWMAGSFAILDHFTSMFYASCRRWSLFRCFLMRCNPWGAQGVPWARRGLTTSELSTQFCQQCWCSRRSSHYELLQPSD